MIMRIFPIVIISTLLLTSCNLAASLMGGAQTFTERATYEVLGEQHEITATFTIDDGIVTKFSLEPGAVSREELAHQLAFGANVPQFVLQKNVTEIVLPEQIGEEKQLTEVFGGMVEKVKARL